MYKMEPATENIFMPIRGDCRSVSLFFKMSKYIYSMKYCKIV